MNIGRAIRTTRQERNMRQQELADRAGITGTYLSLVEKGAREPSNELVGKIAAVLKVSAGFLWFRALDRNDFEPNKRDLFDALYPTIQHIIIQLI